MRTWLSRLAHFESLWKYGFLFPPTEQESGGLGRVQESVFYFSWESMLHLPLCPTGSLRSYCVGHNNLFQLGIFKEFTLQIMACNPRFASEIIKEISGIQMPKRM